MVLGLDVVAFLHIHGLGGEDRAWGKQQWVFCEADIVGIDWRQQSSASISLSLSLSSISSPAIRHCRQQWHGSFKTKAGRRHGRPNLPACPHLLSS